MSKELEHILAEELNVKESEYKKSSANTLKVDLDTNITPELKIEGEVRDLIRSIQQLRKEMNLTLNDKTKIFAPNVSKSYEHMILSATSSVSISEGSELRVEKIEDEISKRS